MSSQLEVRTRMRRDVLAGLRSEPRSIPPKYFYDARGSELFEQITRLEAYYPTRVELSILEAHVDAMASRIGSGCLLVEYGSGSSRKTGLLLAALTEPVAYVPIDIAGEALEAAAAQIAARFPAIEVLPVHADYSMGYEIPSTFHAAERRVGYFPGSTIGNFTPQEAGVFLAGVAEVCGPGGGLLIGVDLEKDVAVLERAYDDPEGVTAEFNLNLLRRCNRELGATFELEAFQHRAFYNVEQHRIEMHLVSLRDQQVEVAGERFAFATGESIHTENSYKYSLQRFAGLAERAGFAVDAVWVDDDELFSVQYLTVQA
ncbi:MAG: L-histidine N(alpha)-methyltransferase [Acidobacteriota bacterium]